MPSRDKDPAKFGPIPPDLDLHTLVEQTPNFKWVDRISCHEIDEAGIPAFEKTVEQQVIKRGVPLIIDGWHHKLERWTFSTRWLHDNVGDKFEAARCLNRKENMTLSVSHYLNHMDKLTNQWNHYNYKEKIRQRIYLKDIDCPDLWHEKLRETLPGSVFYLNESIGEAGGPGSVEDASSSGLGSKKSRGIARAGDLMSCLPPAMRAVNLMCYIGHEGTFTPAHREMCASLGQNIMVETSGALDEGGRRSKPGSSIWFMTETHDRQVVAEYWLSNLGHDIEVEKHFAHINAWRKAPFTVYVVEQKVGDLILIPPLAPHQVWNRGTRTMKVAWNRTTVETLELALDEALPRARLVCRDEQYKNKSIILFTLNKYHGLLGQLDARRREAIATGNEERIKTLSSQKPRQLKRDFKRLFHLFTRILLSEMFSPELPLERKVEYLPYDSNVTCSYCRCNIFNRFLTCRRCVVRYDDGDLDTYDICMDCFVMGRSCKCIGKFEWVEQFPWQDLLEKHELWRNTYVALEGGTKANSPQALSTEKMYLRDRTLAEICQLELKKRPLKDPKRTEAEIEKSDGSDEDVGPNGKVGGKSKRKKKQNDKWLMENIACHICCYRHPVWKEAICTTCGIAFCFGSLWRAFDMMPMDILQEKSWLCPKCSKICTCTTCRKDPLNKPYEPTGTILGHDTREFADPRSVESLVDFSVSNRHWIRKSGDSAEAQDSRRLQRRQSQALQRKEDAKIQDEISDAEGHRGFEDEALPEQSRPGTSDEDIPIDPALMGASQPPGDLKRQKKAQDQAAMALEAVKNLTRLEQDPGLFISAANLSPRNTEAIGNEHTSTILSASLDLISNNDVDSVNGVDHSGPVSKSSKQEIKKSTTTQSNRYIAIPQNSENTQSSGRTANERFQALTERRRIVDAKKNKQLTAARAAMQGLTKLVILKASPSLLARFPLGSSNVLVSSSPQQLSKEDQNVPIIESNQPEQVQLETKPKQRRTSKKKLRGEEDEDFYTSKAHQKHVRQQRAKESRDAEMDSLSDADFTEVEDLASRNLKDAKSKTGPVKERTLPEYLAKRRDDFEIAQPSEIPRLIPSNDNIEDGSENQARQSTSLANLPRKKRLSQQITPSEANRSAKIRTAQGFESESNSDSGDFVETTEFLSMSLRNRSTNTNIEARQETAQERPAEATVNGSSKRKSIFSSRGRRGKIRIASARR